MQAAAPGLIDLSGETRRTLDEYGLDRPEPEIKAARGGGKGEFRAFAANCLLARRLAERGVRFIQLYHKDWDHHGGVRAGVELKAQEIDRACAARTRSRRCRSRPDISRR